MVAAAEQASLDGAFGAVGAGGDLRDRHSIHIEQPHGLPLCSGYGLESLQRLSGLFRPWPGSPLAQLVDSILQVAGIDGSLPSLRGLPVIMAPIAGDLQQPPSHPPRVAQTPNANPGAHQGVLQDVLCGVDVCYCAANEGCQRLLVSSDQGLKGVPVASGASLDQHHVTRIEFRHAFRHFSR